MSTSPKPGIAIGAARYHSSPFRRQRRPLVWAHRGASADAPENTVAAFALARAQGAEGIECDVVRCGSGELVVCHDERLDRLCGLPVAVRELPLGELRRLPVLAQRFPGVEATIPTLEEALEAAGPEMRWNLELKVHRHEEAEPLARAVAEAVARLELERRVVVSSFHPLALLATRTADPAIATAWLLEDGGGARRVWDRLWGRVTATAAIHPEHPLVEAAAVERWHAAGWVVNTWTVDDPVEMRRVAAAGVDGVMTNRPALARATLEA